MKKIKKKRFSYKKTLKFVIPLIIIIILFINRNNIIMFYQSKVTGYEFKTISTFHELDIYDDIKDHKYSDTLEHIVMTEYYNPTYLDSYLDITYHDKDNYFEELNKLLSLGYKAAEINDIYDDLSDDSVKTLTDNIYLKDISNILNLKYFHEDNLKRYLDYSKDKELGYEDLITYVNANLDYKYYTNVKDIEDPKDLTVIVNKYNKLASNYVPDDLETISSKYNLGYNNKMRHEARIHFEEMCESASKDNIKIYSGSA